MFFKLNMLKKLMKSACKSGCLLLGRAECVEDTGEISSYYIISGGWWSIQLKDAFCPKEVKACMLELTGELPVEGRAYQTTKSGNQEMMIEAVPKPIVIFAGGKAKSTVTKLIMEKSNGFARILQDANGETGMINETIIELIDPGKIEEEKGEYMPIGPVKNEDGVYSWGNNICFLSVWPIRFLDEDKENRRKKILSEFERIDLRE